MSFHTLKMMKSLIKYLRLKRFWMSKSKNSMNETRGRMYIRPLLFITHPETHAVIAVHLSSQKVHLFNMFRKF